MKKRIGMICGFVSGISSFLFMFKIIFLNHIPPEDELAPGIVVALAILNGFLFAYAGDLIQHHFGKSGTSSESTADR